MALQPGSVGEAPQVEDLGFFFRRLGEVCFSSAADQSFNGPAACVAVAATCGAVFFSDAQGLHAARTQDVVAALQKWNGEGQMPLSDAAAVCRLVVPGAAPLLSLSQDEGLLAACEDSLVRIYSTQRLVEGGDSSPLASFQLKSPVKQLAWRPSTEALPSFVIVTVEGALLAGTPADPAPAPLPLAAPAGAACAAWSPGGGQLAVGRGDEVAVCGPDGGQRFAVKVVSQEVVEGQHLQVDSLRWLDEAAILVSCMMLEGEDDVVDLAPQCVLTWQAVGGGAPADVNLTEYFAPNIFPEAAEGSGPWLHVAEVDAWGTAVYCHRLSNDDHIKVAVVSNGNPVAADMTDDRLAIRIPNAPDDEDNYVVGMGLDFTSTGVTVEHPTDPNAPDLPPQPVLLVATSDGVLRAYTFGNMASAASVVAAPRPLPPPPPVLPRAAAPAAAAPAAAADLEGKAAATALPSDGEEDDWEQVEAEDGGAAAAGAPAAAAGGESQDKAAATALPSDGEESGLEEEEEEKEESSKAPAGTAPAKPLFAFATSATAAPTSAAPPAFGLGAPGAPPAFTGSGASAGSTPGFALGGAGSTAPAFSLGGAASSAAASTEPAFSLGGAASTAAASSAPLFGGLGSSAASGAAPGFGFAPPPAPAAQQPAKPPSAEPAAAAAPPPAAKPPAASQPAAEKAATEAPAKPAVPAKPAKPPLKKTEVEAPAPRLQGEAAEAAAMEADFLASLHHTRKLEAELHDALTAALRHEEGPGSYPGFVELRKQTLELRMEVEGLAGRLAEQRARFAELSGGVKDAHRKCEALPCFQPAPQGGAGSSVARSREALLLRQPLEPPLAALRASIKAQLSALRLKSDELQECLMALEERQRQYKSGDTAPPKLTSQQLYNAVNSQMAVAQAQAARLESLAQHMQAAGLLREDALGGGDAGEEEAEEEQAGGGGFAAQLGALRLGESPLGSRLKPGPRQGSSAKKRSPWRLVRESPVAGRRQSLSPLAGSTPTSAQAPGGVSPSGRLAHAFSAGTPPAACAWAGPGARGLSQQILERVKSEGGGLRVTAPKRRPPPLALPSPAADAAKQALVPAATAAAAEDAVPEPPMQPPALPAFSLSAPATPPAPTAAAAKPSKPPAAPAARAFGAAPASGSGGLFGGPGAAPASGGGTLFGSAGSAPAFGGFGAAPAFSGFGAPAAPAAPAGDQGEEGGAFFLPAPSFQGAKPGYVYKLDGSGLGYYRDIPLPTAGSIFGKDTAKPPTPSFAAPGAPAPGKTLSKQPPLPSMAQVKAASEQMQRVLGGGARPADEAKGPEGAKAEEQRPKEAAKPKQPPIPSMSQFAQSQQMLAKLSPAGKPAAAPAATAAAALASAAPRAAGGSQPPIPSLAAAKAAQQRFDSFVSGKKEEPAAPAAPAAAGQQQAPAAAAAASAEVSAEAPEAAQPPPAAAAAPSEGLSFGGMELGPTAGEAADGASPFAKALSFGTASSGGLFGSTSGSAAAPAAASSAASLFGATPGAGAASVFGGGGAAPAGAATSSSGGGLFDSVAPASRGGGLFGTTAAAAPASSTGGLLGASASPASSGGLFGAASAPAGASSPFGATSAFGALGGASKAASSPFGALGSAPAAPASAPGFGGFGFGAASSGAAASPFAPAGSAAAASPFAPASGAAAGSPFAPASSAAAGSPFAPASGAAAGSPFSPAASSQPSFGAFGSATPFGAAAASPSSPFGGGFGQPAAPASPLGATSVFGQPATPGFGTPATPGLGAPAAPAFGGAFGQPTALGVGAPAGGSVFGGGSAFGTQAAQQQGGFGAQAAQQQGGFGAQATQQQGGGFGAFGQQQGGGFGAFGQQAQQPGGFGAFGGGSPVAAAPKPGGNPAMWAMRK